MALLNTRTLLLTGVAFAAAAVGSPVLAQTSPNSGPADPPPSSDANAAEAGVSEVIVTGSRLRTGFQTPTPVVVETTEQLRNANPTSLAEALVQLPVFRNSSRAQNASISSVRDNGAAFLNLRGLGAQRTLVLLDGRRIVASTSSGSPDVNLIPQELVKRVDVVTGGASAAYGSDAVAGVVNFILDRDFTGLRATGQLGTSGHGDGDSRQATLTYGSGFAGNRAHLLVSAEYAKTDSIGPPGGRDFAEAGWAIITNPAAPPLKLIASNVNMGNATYGGLILGGPLNNTQFLPGGATAPFVLGTAVTATTMIGGDGARFNQALTAGIERGSVFGRVEYDLTDSLRVFAEGAYAQVESSYDQVAPNTTGANGFTIFNDNAFLSAAVKARMAAAGVTSFRLSRYSQDFGYIHADSRSRTARGTVGLTWKAADNWEVQSYYMHGENDYRVDTSNNNIWRRTFAAADAVVGPTGQIVCRSTLAGLDPGCVPLNVLGAGSPSADALNYILGDAVQRLKLKEDVASFSVRGEPFSLPAGPVSFAAGVEYRKEGAVQTGDPISVSVNSGAGLRGFPAGLEGALGGFYLANPQPLSGSYNVKEGFAEIEVPLAKDLPFVKFLTVNGAARLVSYSTVGEVTTWKLGFSYEPFSDLRFRGTRSRDIRAANIAELYSSPVNTQGFVFVNNVNTPWTGKRRGNPLLEPEIAKSSTVGVIYRPSWLSGFNVSLDYYDIKLGGAISQLTAQQTIDQCAAGSAVACAQKSTSAGGVLFLDLPTLNLSSIKTSGYDLEVSYAADIGPGRLGLRGIVSKLEKLVTTVPGSAPVERAGDIGISGTPKLSGTFGALYTQGPVQVYLQERFIGKGKVDNLATVTTFADNSVKSAWYTDLTVKYDLTVDNHELQIFGTVNNLFDKDPPIVPTVPFGVYRATNFSLYDVIGRYFTTGVRIKF